MIVHVWLSLTNADGNMLRCSQTNYLTDNTVAVATHVAVIRVVWLSLTYSCGVLKKSESLAPLLVPCTSCALTSYLVFYLYIHSTSQNVFLAACALMGWYWMAVEDVFPKINAHVSMEGAFINLGKPSKWTATHGMLFQGALFCNKGCSNCQCVVHPWSRMYFEAFLFTIRAIRLLLKIKGETFPLHSMLHEPAVGENKYQDLLWNDFHPFLQTASTPGLEVPASSRLVCGWSFYKGELILCLLGTEEPRKRIEFRGGRNHNDLPVTCSASGCIVLK